MSDRRNHLRPEAEREVSGFIEAIALIAARLSDLAADEYGPCWAEHDEPVRFRAGVGQAHQDGGAEAIRHAAAIGATIGTLAAVGRHFERVGNDWINGR